MRRGKRRRGSVLVMFALAMITLIGGSGIVVDYGRMYIAKAESQTFVDAAALAAVRELDGSNDGVSRAVTAATEGDWKRWHFAGSEFDAVDVRFCVTVDCDWSAAPTGPPDNGFRFVRVASTVQVPIFLMHVIAAGATRTVNAYAVAGLERMRSFTGGTYPFFVGAKAPAGGGAEEPCAGNHCGFIVGESYTFRWSNRAGTDLVNQWTKWQAAIAKGQPYNITAELVKLGWCSGDATEESVNYFVSNLDLSSPNALFSNKGFFLPANVNGGTSTISDAVQGGYQPEGYTIGTDIEYAELLPGTRQAIEKDIQDRIQHELDLAPIGLSTNDVPTYVASLESQAAVDISIHSRIVIVPVVAPGAYDSAATSAEIIDFLPFLLLTDSHGGANAYGGPNSYWCMKYLGSINFATGAPVPGGTGIFYPRLVR